MTAHSCALIERTYSLTARGRSLMARAPPNPHAPKGLRRRHTICVVAAPQRCIGSLRIAVGAAPSIWRDVAVTRAIRLLPRAAKSAWDRPSLPRATDRPSRGPLLRGIVYLTQGDRVANMGAWRQLSASSLSGSMYCWTRRLRVFRFLVSWQMPCLSDAFRRSIQPAGGAQ